MRQKVYRNVIEFVLCWPASPGHGAYPEVWLIYPVRLHWKKLLIFPLPAVIN